MRAKIIVYSALIALIACSAQAQNSAQPKPDDTVPVTADNFVRAESDTYFASSVK